MTDTPNPYQFDNDEFQRASTGLDYYVDKLWLAGASEEQIHDVVTERTGLIQDGTVDASATGPEVEPSEEDTESPVEEPEATEEESAVTSETEENVGGTPEEEAPTEVVQESEPVSNETDEDDGRPIGSSEIP